MATASRPLSLNGHLIRLGTFDDAIHVPSDHRQISIDFCFEIPKMDSVAAVRANWLNTVGRISRYNQAEEVREISGSFVWAPKAVAGSGGVSTQDRLQSDLLSGRFSVVSGESGGVETTTTMYAEYGSKKGVPPTALFDSESMVWGPVSVDDSSRTELTHDKPDGEVQGSVTRYFLPGWFLVSYDGAKLKSQNLAEYICTSRSMLSSYGLEGELVPPAAAALVSNWLALRGASGIETGEGWTRASELAARLEPYKRRPHAIPSALPAPSLFPVGISQDVSLTDLDGLREELQEILREHLPQMTDHEVERPRVIGSAADFIQQYFQFGVRYLGPLRDEPRPVYPLEALENTTEVGYRGEHTAAVLYLNGRNNISYIKPDAFAKYGADATPTQEQLHVAVGEWLRYMGVATAAIADDSGVFGNTLKVETEGLAMRHDLTNVGVGVSQVLPIIVSSLLAPKTSLLIFEQPELHLHPRVQARLADFFFAIALTGKRCVLETHSEYMVERFRRRIAEETEDKLVNMIALYFTERVAGKTHCRPVEVTRYGSVLNWPKDFFEQSQIETREILSAASKKRMRKVQEKK